MGEVSINVLHVGLGGLFAVTRRHRPWGLSAAISVDAFGMFFEPAAGANAVAVAKADLALTAWAVLAGWVTLASPLRLGWEAGAAYSIRPVVVKSGGETLESTEGVGLRGALDVVVDF